MYVIYTYITDKHLEPDKFNIGPHSFDFLKTYQVQHKFEESIKLNTARREVLLSHKFVLLSALRTNIIIYNVRKKLVISY